MQQTLVTISSLKQVKTKGKTTCLENLNFFLNLNRYYRFFCVK